MELSGKLVKLELDMGATVTLVFHQVFEKLFPEVPIQKSTVKFKTYTGEPMKVLGEVTVGVHYHHQQLQELPLVIVKGRGPPLLGRNWL